MLADDRLAIGRSSGSLGRHVHLPATSLNRMLDFIGQELPRWRDRSDRKAETSETILTSQLCAHLSSAARHSPGWDFLQFRMEEPDEQVRGRRLDLVATPCGVTVWIEGRKHSDFDTLLPIECKRLPTPRSANRDQREYVISSHSSTGGIQRFKCGLHAANHKVAAMIGYVQHDARVVWHKRISSWIGDLVTSHRLGWTADDLLDIVRDDDNLRLMVLRSRHLRTRDLEALDLRHFWISMTQEAPGEKP